MRPRKKNKGLPSCMYLKHGAYYYVKNNKWERLSSDYPLALNAYARKIQDPGKGMVELIEKAHIEIIDKKAINTVKQYTQACEYLKNALREFSPEQVKPKDVAAIKSHYKDRPNMGNRMLSYLRLVFNLAVEWQLVDSNPCIGIKRHPERQDDRYITDEEFLKIRAAATPNLVAIIDIAYLTGQRISDILNIHLKDISDKGIYFEQKKTGNRLLVQMDNELQQAINRAKKLERNTRGETLFCTMRGGRAYKYGTVRDMFRRAVEKAGIQRTTWHHIRAKALTDADMEGKNAQKLGGHTDKRTTRIYIRRRQTILAESPSFRQPLDTLDD